MKCFRSEVDKTHNAGRPIRWSRTYVDDGMFICPTFEINECTHEYQSPVSNVLGIQAVQDIYGFIRFYFMVNG